MAAAGATGNQKTVDCGGEGCHCGGGSGGEVIGCFVGAVGKGAGDGGIAEMIDGMGFSGEGTGSAVGGEGATKAGKTGAGDGIGKGGHGAGFGVGDGGVCLPPMGLMGLIGRMGCGDAVGTGEIDGAVEVEILAGEEEVAEFVVFVEGSGVNAVRRTGFGAD